MSAGFGGGSGGAGGGRLPSMRYTLEGDGISKGKKQKTQREVRESVRRLGHHPELDEGDHVVSNLSVRQRIDEFNRALAGRNRRCHSQVSQTHNNRGDASSKSGLSKSKRGLKLELPKQNGPLKEHELKIFYDINLLKRGTTSVEQRQGCETETVKTEDPVMTKLGTFLIERGGALENDAIDLIRLFYLEHLSKISEEERLERCFLAGCSHRAGDYQTACKHDELADGKLQAIYEADTSEILRKYVDVERRTAGMPCAILDAQDVDGRIRPLVIRNIAEIEDMMPTLKKTITNVVKVDKNSVNHVDKAYKAADRACLSPSRFPAAPHWQLGEPSRKLTWTKKDSWVLSVPRRLRVIFWDGLANCAPVGNASDDNNRFAGEDGAQDGPAPRDVEEQHAANALNLDGENEPEGERRPRIVLPPEHQQLRRAYDPVMAELTQKFENIRLRRFDPEMSRPAPSDKPTQVFAVFSTLPSVQYAKLTYIKDFDDGDVEMANGDCGCASSLAPKWMGFGLSLDVLQKLANDRATDCCCWTFVRALESLPRKVADSIMINILQQHNSLHQFRMLLNPGLREDANQEDGIEMVVAGRAPRGEPEGAEAEGDEQEEESEV